MIYDNPIDFLVHYIPFVSLLIIYFSSKILSKNKVLIGFKSKKAKKVGFLTLKKKVFLFFAVIAVFVIPMDEIKKISYIKNGEILCSIGVVDQSEENLEDEVYFKEFILDTVDGRRQFFDGEIIDPDEALARGKQTYVLFYRKSIFKVAYMEKNIKIGQLKATQERLINEYLESINLSYFDKENIREIKIEYYVISIVLMTIATIFVIKLILFIIRYHSLIRKVKKYDSEERGRIKYERNYNGRVY